MAYRSKATETISQGVKNELKDAKEKIERWKIKPDRWSAIDKSCQKVYKH